MTPPADPAPAPNRHVQRSEATRAKLIAAAVDVVQARSYHGTSMFEVAKAAGVTPGALQHHFGSKAMLMMQVIDDILRSGDGVAWPDAALPLPARAQGYVQALWERVYEPPRFLAAWGVYFGSSHDPALRAHIAERRAAINASMRARFEALFPEVVQGGEPAAFVALVLSCLRGIALTRLFDPDPAGSAAQLQALADTIVRRCSTAPLPPARRRPR